jgi:hypothetical protein
LYNLVGRLFTQLTTTELGLGDVLVPRMHCFSLFMLDQVWFFFALLLSSSRSSISWFSLGVALLRYYIFVQVRLGWHDAGTYDKNITEWPKCGGANGSLRFEVELKHGANAGNTLLSLSSVTS